MADAFGDEICPKYQRAVEILGKRWTGLIIRTLLVRPRRFGEITGSVTGLSDRLLSERLKELESCEIVERRVFSETPVRIEYTLTTKGLELERVVEAIQHWANCWDATSPASHSHMTANGVAPEATGTKHNEPRAARSSFP